MDKKNKNICIECGAQLPNFDCTDPRCALIGNSLLTEEKVKTLLEEIYKEKRKDSIQPYIKLSTYCCVDKVWKTLDTNSELPSECSTCNCIIKSFYKSLK